jgi:hypothetical protein
MQNISIAGEKKTLVAGENVGERVVDNQFIVQVPRVLNHAEAPEFVHEEIYS